MRHPSVADLRVLLRDHEAPCISLYQPTHRSYPETQQDPIRYGNLMKEIESALRKHHPKRDFGELTGRFRAFLDDESFWIQGGGDGLAVFGSPDHFAVFRLRRAVPELAIVADSFHTKPLLRVLQSADRYQILALSRSEARLYEGSRDELERIELDGVPATIEEALGEEVTGRPSKIPSSGRMTKQGAGGIYYGHGEQSAEVELDRDRFFRAVDRAVLERYSRPSGLPLILAALPEHQTHFRRISRNPHLIEAAITENAHAMTVDELRRAAWEKVEPLYLERLARLKEEFGSARAHERGSDDPADVAAAVVQGRVGTLLVDAERRMPGRLDEFGRVDWAGSGDSGTDDLLDDLAEAVLRRDGQVVIVPASRMPTDKGVAAIYRF